MIVVAADGEASADRASDQGAKRSADQTCCHTATRGLISRSCSPERCACAEADQSAYWRERGWVWCECGGVGSSARRRHGAVRRSGERGSLSDDFIFA
jgi:hypothetical protein